jgi:hypothetical protein
MQAKSIKGKTAQEIKAGLEKSITDGLQPTLAVVFISIESELDGVCKVLSEKNIAIFGSSTGGGFLDSEIEVDSIVILLLDLDRDSFEIKLLETGSATTTSIAEQIGKAGLDRFRKPSFIIISAGLRTDGDEIVAGIGKSCGEGTTLFGGLAADQLKMERTFVFTNDALTDYGMLALILDEEKISISGIAVGGWRPIGMDRVITRSAGNVVYEIDNEPAMDFILRYAGIKELEAENMVAFFMASNFQVQLQRENKHPVMRSPMQANALDRSVIFSGALPQGSKMRLCLLPGFEVIEETLAEFTAYKNTQPNADAMIMFSCAGRQISLGPYVSNEIDGVKKIWNIPMAGFFCYGEIGRIASGDIEFHGMTCSLALLKEK